MWIDLIDQISKTSANQCNCDLSIPSVDPFNIDS